ncbi:MAG: membrane integrity-associated transporter subunit PqiC [Pseudomonadales bacterium]|nr:membrane integrity-associated transporter subunit PqiC [Pseudomonadales bacterium]
MRSNQVLVSLILLIFLSACSSSGSAPIRYYVLEPIDQEAINDSEISIQIVDLHIPQYLERFQMVTRAGRNELVFSDSHQWGENLRKNLLRVLSVNLSALLGTPEVSTPLTRSKRKADIKVKIFVERFDQTHNGLIMLNARYQIVESNTGASLPQTYAFSGEIVNQSARNYPSMVGNMGKLYNELSADIARHLVVHHLKAQERE